MNLNLKFSGAGKIILLLVCVLLSTVRYGCERQDIIKQEKIGFKALECVFVVKEFSGHFVNYIG